MYTFIRAFYNSLTFIFVVILNILLISLLQFEFIRSKIIPKIQTTMLRIIIKKSKFFSITFFNSNGLTIVPF